MAVIKVWQRYNCIYTPNHIDSAELTDVEVSAVKSKMRPYCGVQMNHGSQKIGLNLLQLYEIDINMYSLKICLDYVVRLCHLLQ